MLLKHYLEHGDSQSELARRFGIDRTTIWRQVRTGQLDRDLSAGPNRTAGRASVAGRIRHARTKPACGKGCGKPGSGFSETNGKDGSGHDSKPGCCCDPDRPSRTLIARHRDAHWLSLLSQRFRT